MAKRKKAESNQVVSKTPEESQKNQDPNESSKVIAEIQEVKEDVQEIMEEVTDSGKEVEELKEEVEGLREGISEILEMTKTHKTMMDKISSKLHFHIPSKFNVNDIAQQVVGAIILSTPFTVTEEVWNLAADLDIVRLCLIIFLTIMFDVLLIYFAKFQQIDLSSIFSVFARLFSMIVVSYLAAGLLLYAFGVIGNEVTDIVWAAKLIILVGLPANIGAATADVLK